VYDELTYLSKFIRKLQNRYLLSQAQRYTIGILKAENYSQSAIGKHRAVEHRNGMQSNKYKQQKAALTTDSEKGTDLLARFNFLT
jgi:hypothetical protein